MIPKFDMLDPDDYLYVDVYNDIRKIFPSLTWDDVVRRGLEEWMLLAERDETVKQIQNKCANLKDDLYRWEGVE